MCDADLRNKIIAKVDALIAAQKMFTAWDVTRLLRQDGEWARHDEVRTEVHNLFNDGEMSVNYLRSNVCIDPSTTTYAQVFHNSLDNPDDYDKSALTTTPTSVVNPTPAVVPTPVSTPTAVKAPLNNDVLTTDCRGRILIKKSLVQKLGLNPGDNANVWLGLKGDLCVSSTQLGSGAKDYRLYIVDKYGEVRIKPGLWNVTSTSFKTEFNNRSDTLFVFPA
jgi:hypothetical protein